VVAMSVVGAALPASAQGDIINQILGIAVGEAMRQQQLEQQGAGAQRPNGTRVARAVLPKSAIAQLQRQLNALGYPAGKADGVMGRGTRQAFAAWQADQGLPQTAEVTQADWDLLMAQTPSTTVSAGPQSVPSGEAMSLLYDTDLPQNDYRSGMEDPALKRITLEQCMAYCEGDTQCRAFTYNSKARVCFLKSFAGAPEGFSGAVSGVKGEGGGAAQEAALDTRPLEPAEIAELQAALNARGYDAGEADGRIGRKTRDAIVAFGRDFPGASSGRVDVALLLTVTSLGTPAASTSFAADAYRRLDDIDRALGLIAVARDDGYLADEYTALEWLRQDARAGLGRDAKALYAAYEDANEIERSKLLDTYRASLVDEAKAFVTNPANSSLRVRVEGRVSVGAFDPTVGLRVGTPRVDFFTDRKFDHRSSLARVDFVGLALDLPEILSLPMADEAAASAFLDQMASKSYDNEGSLVAYLTLSNFGTDANVSGAAAADADDVPVTVRLDRLALLTVRGRDGEAAPGGEELAALIDTTVTVLSGPQDPLIVAKMHGLAMVDGHIVVPADSYNSNSKPFFDLASLALDPTLAKDRLDNDSIRSLMTRSQRLRVFGDQEYMQLGNEFERRRALKTFNEQIVPELLARAPAFPIPVVVIRPVALRDYDFEAGAFPLDYNGSNDRVFELPQNLAGLAASQFYANLPTALVIDEKVAEQMIAQGRQRTIYLATFGTLVASTREGGGFDLRLESTRMGLFSDSAFATPLLELDPALMLADSEPRPVTVAEEAEPELAPLPERFEMLSYDGRALFVPEEFPGRDELRPMGALLALRANMTLLDERDSTMMLGHMLGFDLTPYLTAEGAKDLRESYFEPDYFKWAGADEFQREDTRKRFIADYRARIEQMLPRLPFEISVLDQAALREYDMSAGAFPIQVAERGQLTPYDRYDEEIVASTLEPALEPELSLPMSEPDARAFRETLRAKTGTLLDQAVFGNVEVAVASNMMATITTYRVESITWDGSVQIRSTPLTRGLYLLSDLRTPLAELPFPEPTVAEQPPTASRPSEPAQSAEAIAIAEGSAEIPQSRFDMLGVKLGMNLDEARRILDERFAGKGAIAMTRTPPDWSAECGRIQARLDEELAGAAATEGSTIRESYFGDFLQAACPIPELFVVDFAFGYELPQDDGTMDRVRVFSAPKSGNVVGAIMREVPSDMQDAMTNGLVDKYGADFTVGDGNSLNRYWVEDTSMGANFRRNNSTECDTDWYEPRVPQIYVTTNCGAFVRQLDQQVMLVDTRYNAQQTRRVLEWAAAILAAEPPPRLEF